MLLRRFPKQAATLLAPRNGIIIQPRGDGVLLSKCTPVKNYTLISSRMIKENASQPIKCYNNIPVKIKDEYWFLDIATMTISKVSEDPAIKKPMT